MDLRLDRLQNLILDYRLTGMLDDILARRMGDSERTDELWRSTCFELFSLDAKGQSYREFNFSPTGQWQCYAFTHYRAGRSLPELNPVPEIVFSTTAHNASARIRLNLNALPWPGKIRLGLSAVIEHQNSGIGYWAVEHPADRADFHQAGAWRLELDKQLGRMAIAEDILI